MSKAKINGINIGFDLIGDGDRPWVLTPGGRYQRHTPGLAELAGELAKNNGRVLIWDRPNCGESDLSFEGSSESDLNADTLVGLLEHLDMTPAVIAAGSAGARVSLLAAHRHPGSALGLALWWPSGGSYELFILGNHYYSPSIKAAWVHDMAAVADLPDWAEQIAMNPGNRQRILDQDRQKFLDTMDRWQLAFSPRDGELIPGLPNDDLARIEVPALVFQSGEVDANHPRWVSQALADTLPKSRLVDPPWGDGEWWERQAEHDRGIFIRWPLLAPQLASWADEVLGGAS